MTKREQIVNAARMYLGVPFFHAGRSIYGVDCIGLLILATREAGIDVFDETNYSPIINSVYLMYRINQCCHKIDRKEVLRGDMVLFRIGRSEQHMGLITEIEPLYMIHSFQTVGKVVEHALDAHWEPRIAGFYRLNEELLANG